MSRHTVLMAVGVFAMAMLVYLMTLSPTINSFDSAEFTTAAHELGIVHATGYPLYLLTGHTLRYLPIAEYPIRLNALSAVYAALAAAITALTAERLTGRPLIAAGVGLLVAFSGMVWAQAVLAEVYTLTALLTAALVYAALVWRHTGDHRAMWATAFVFGLSLTNHLASALFGIGGVLLCAAALREKHHTPAEWAIAAGVGLLPLSLYAYLPIRYAAGPALNYVGQYFDISLATPGGLLWMVSGRMFAREMFGVPLLEGLAGTLTLLGVMWRGTLGVGLIVAVIGVWRLWPRQRIFTAFLVISAVAVLVFFGFYNVFDADTMIIPALVALAPLAAEGLRDFEDKRLPPYLGALVVGILVAASLAINWRFADRSGDTAAYDFAVAVFDAVEPDALVLAFWTTATPLEYLQIVEGQRPDVDILDRGLYVLGVRDSLLRRGVNEDLGPRMTATLHAEIRAALAVRPVYITENDPSIRGAFCLVSVEGAQATLYRLVPEPTPSTPCLTEDD